jgi:predicted DsbA family dithiol-disulfide isomerase
MNIHVPQKARLMIEVVHDLVCPWCYLGVQRLLHTLHRRPDIATTLVWHPPHPLLRRCPPPGPLRRP